MSSYARVYLDLRDPNQANAQISGESTHAGFVDQIELSGWDWGLTRPHAEEGGRAKAQPGTFTLSKTMDRSSTVMLNKLMNGDALTATLTLHEAMESPFKLVVRLDKVRIVNYHVDGQDEDKNCQIKENWTFNYDEITLTHTLAAHPNNPLSKISKTITSTLKRSAEPEDEDRRDSVKKVIQDFSSLDPDDQGKAVQQMQEEAPSAFKLKNLGKSFDSGFSDSAKANVLKGASVKEVVAAFLALTRSGKNDAARLMQAEAKDAFAKKK